MGASAPGQTPSRDRLSFLNDAVPSHSLRDSAAAAAALTQQHVDWGPLDTTFAALWEEHEGEQGETDVNTGFPMPALEPLLQQLEVLVQQAELPSLAVALFAFAARQLSRLAREGLAPAECFRQVFTLVVRLLHPPSEPPVAEKAFALAIAALNLATALVRDWVRHDTGVDRSSTLVDFAMSFISAIQRMDNLMSSLADEEEEEEAGERGEGSRQAEAEAVAGAGGLRWAGAAMSCSYLLALQLRSTRDPALIVPAWRVVPIAYGLMAAARHCRGTPNRAEWVGLLRPALLLVSLSKQLRERLGLQQTEADALRPLDQVHVVSGLVQLLRQLSVWYHPIPTEQEVSGGEESDSDGGTNDGGGSRGGSDGGGRIGVGSSGVAPATEPSEPEVPREQVGRALLEVAALLSTLLGAGFQRGGFLNEGGMEAGVRHLEGFWHAAEDRALVEEDQAYAVLAAVCECLYQAMQGPTAEEAQSWFNSSGGIMRALDALDKSPSAQTVVATAAGGRFLAWRAKRALLRLLEAVVVGRDAHKQQFLHQNGFESAWRCTDLQAWSQAQKEQLDQDPKMVLAVRGLLGNAASVIAATACRNFPDEAELAAVTSAQVVEKIGEYTSLKTVLSWLRWHPHGYDAIDAQLHADQYNTIFLLHSAVFRLALCLLKDDSEGAHLGALAAEPQLQALFVEVLRLPEDQFMWNEAAISNALQSLTILIRGHRECQPHLLGLGLLPALVKLLTHRFAAVAAAEANLQAALRTLRASRAGSASARSLEEGHREIYSCHVRMHRAVILLAGAALDVLSSDPAQKAAICAELGRESMNEGLLRALRKCGTLSDSAVQRERTFLLDLFKAAERSAALANQPTSVVTKIMAYAEVAHGREEAAAALLSSEEREREQAAAKAAKRERLRAKKREKEERARAERAAREEAERREKERREKEAQEARAREREARLAAQQAQQAAQQAAQQKGGGKKGRGKQKAAAAAAAPEAGARPATPVAEGPATPSAANLLGAAPPAVSLAGSHPSSAQGTAVPEQAQQAVAGPILGGGSSSSSRSQVAAPALPHAPAPAAGPVQSVLQAPPGTQPPAQAAPLPGPGAASSLSQGGSALASDSGVDAQEAEFEELLGFLLPGLALGSPARPSPAPAPGMPSQQQQQAAPLPPPSPPPQQHMSGWGGAATAMSRQGPAAGSGAPGQQLSALAAVLCCRLTGRPLIDPVVAADGHTYERGAIQGWLAAGSSVSPATGQPLDSGVLRPNFAVRQLIESLT